MRNQKLGASSRESPAKPAIQPVKRTGPKASWNLYSLDHLDVELRGLKRAAKLIGEQVFCDYMHNESKGEDWKMSARGENWFDRYRYLKDILGSIEQLIFLNLDNRVGGTANYLSRIPEKLGKKQITDKINLIIDLLAQYLFHVQQEDSNPNVLTIKLEIHGFSVSLWNQYLDQIVQLKAKAHVRHFADDRIVDPSQIEVTPALIPHNTSENVSLIRSKIMKMERLQNGMRVHLKKVGRLITKERVQVLTFSSEKSKSEFQKNLQFLHFLIRLIKCIPRVDRTKRCPGFEKYFVWVPEQLTAKYVGAKGRALIHWLDEFRDQVLEINEDVELEKLSEIPRYQGFYGKWREFMDHVLSIPAEIELELALIETQNAPGFDDFKLISERKKKLIVEIMSSHNVKIIDPSSGCSGMLMKRRFQRKRHINSS